MQKDHLVKIINAVLKEPWTADDMKDGKNVYCMPAWKNSIKTVLPLYIEKGWIIQKRVSISSRGRQLFINFNKKWLE